MVTFCQHQEDHDPAELTGGGGAWWEGALAVGAGAVCVFVGVRVVLGVVVAVRRFTGERTMAAAFGTTDRAGRAVSVRTGAARRAAKRYGVVARETDAAEVPAAEATAAGVRVAGAVVPVPGAVVPGAVVPVTAVETALVPVTAASRADSADESVKASGEATSRPPAIATDPTVKPPAATAVLPIARARARDLVRFAIGPLQVATASPRRGAGARGRPSAPALHSSAAIGVCWSHTAFRIRADTAGAASSECSRSHRQ
jgi:hypothetical protein